MFDSLEKWIGVRTFRGRMARAEFGAHKIQALAQTSEQMVGRLQSKKRTDCPCGRFDGNTSQQLAKQLPKKRGIKGVSGQSVGEKEREGASATRAITAIGTEHTLAARDRAGGLSWIVALKKAVTVQRTGQIAEWAALLFERKSVSSS